MYPLLKVLLVASFTSGLQEDPDEEASCYLRRYPDLAAKFCGEHRRRWRCDNTGIREHFEYVGKAENYSWGCGDGRATPRAPARALCPAPRGRARGGMRPCTHGLPRMAVHGDDGQS